MKISGTVAAVTGAARGIGFATAKALADGGARVAIGDLDEDAARKAAEELGGAGSGVIGLALDVTDETSFASFLDTTEEQLGPLGILVNNAGVMPVGAYLEEDPATTQRTIEVNLLGVMRGCRLAAPRMVARREGAIVNIASMAGKAGFAHITSYTASKHGVVGLTEALREELRGSGVQLTAIFPSLVNTELATGAAKTLVPPLEPAEVAAVVVEAIDKGWPDATVPRWLTVLSHTLGAMPSRVKAWAARQAGGEVYSGSDAAARAQYEQRLRDHASNDDG